jgi:dihydroxyacetone kinase-like protein
MNRIINDADLVVEDAVRGYLKAHGDLVAPTDNPRVIRHRLAPQQGKAGVVTGGGSGHEPALPGLRRRRRDRRAGDRRDLLFADGEELP